MATTFIKLIFHDRIISCFTNLLSPRQAIPAAILLALLVTGVLSSAPAASTSVGESASQLPSRDHGDGGGLLPEALHSGDLDKVHLEHANATTSFYLFNNISSLTYDQKINESLPEALPSPLPQRGGRPQPRNYVAYIPVPINDEDEEAGKSDSSDDEEYEYYDEDEEEAEGDDEYYYYEDEDEEEPPPPPKRRRPSRRRPSSSRRRRPPNRNRDRDDDDDGDKERVPFLVPLMMVPESEVGIDKPFSFAGDQLKPGRGGGNRGNGVNPGGGGSFNPRPNRRFNNNFQQGALSKSEHELIS